MTIANPTVPKKLSSFVWLQLKDHKWALLGFAIINLVWSLEISLSPYLLKLIVDGAIKTSAHPQQLLAVILWPAILYASMSVIINFNFRLYDYICLRLFPKIKANIIHLTYAYLSKHSYRYFADHFAGGLSKKIFDLTSGIEAVIEIPNTVILPRFVAAIVASITLSSVNPLLGVILFIWTGLYLTLGYYAAKSTADLSYQVSVCDNNLSGVVVDSITNMFSVKIFANYPREQENIDNAANVYVTKDRALSWHMLKIHFLQGLWITLLVVLMLWVLIDGRLQQKVTAGDFALVLSLCAMFTSIIYSTGQELIRFSKEVGKCRQALNIIVEPHEIQDEPQASVLQVNKGRIVFDRVQFEYQGSEPLFENKSIIIEPGQKVGLVGHSGSGKSTFVNLILRLFDVTQGRILIDNKDIKHVTQQSLHQQIALIPQDPSLFHRTLFENIQFGRVDASYDEVIQAAKSAHAHEFIERIPQGYDALVGERGVKLSGGQRQRIAIARAFLKNAPILILDEATSQLDSLTEQYIQDSLWVLMQGKTTLVIAHRLSTLLHMDRILVFDNGKIVEDGTHQDLLAKDGLYASLWKTQVGGFLLDEEG